MKAYIIVLFFFLSNLSLFGQDGQNAYALINGKIETITNGTINGHIVIQNGKISALGADVVLPDDITIIDCEGQTIYPGMIDSGTRLGLVEVGSIPLTQDMEEVGDIIPQMEALTAINPSSVAIPVTRVSGVTTTLSVPRGGTFPGTAALINLNGFTPNQMYAGFKGVVLNFPTFVSKKSKKEKENQQTSNSEKKRLKTINAIWDAALLYAKLKNTPGATSASYDYDPVSEALYSVIMRETSLLIEVNRVSDIESAINWVQDKNIKVAFMGVIEGWRIAEKIAKAKIPVIVGPVLRLPSRTSDRYDKPYANAGILHKAGVKVAIRTNEEANSRNLPFHAGFAATYGMGKKAALEAITIVPAEIFGVSEQLGSLELGKDANLFVADGDPFESKTQVTYLFIKGEKIPVSNRQIQLYHKFSDRQTNLTNQ